VERLTTPQQRATVDDDVARARSKPDLERQQAAKTSVSVGSYAVHPAHAERVPIWIADYVRSGTRLRRERAWARCD